VDACIQITSVSMSWDADTFYHRCGRHGMDKGVQYAFLRRHVIMFVSKLKTGEQSLIRIWMPAFPVITPSDTRLRVLDQRFDLSDH